MDGKFIPKEPWVMLKEGNFNQVFLSKQFLVQIVWYMFLFKVPIIMGYNRDEGLLLTFNFLKDKVKLDTFNSDIEKNLITVTFGRCVD